MLPIGREGKGYHPDPIPTPPPATEGHTHPFAVLADPVLLPCYQGLSGRDNAPGKGTPPFQGRPSHCAQWLEYCPPSVARGPVNGWLFGAVQKEARRASSTDLTPCGLPCGLNAEPQEHTSNRKITCVRCLRQPQSTYGRE